MKTYLVTGGAGFIGTNLVRALQSAGHHVRVLDNYCAGSFADRKVAGVEYVVGDVCSRTDVERAMNGVAGVFHLAALPRVAYSVEFPFETHMTNVVGTLQVLLAAKNCGGIKVVFSSSAAVYGDQPTSPLVETMRPLPLSPYGLHKYESEEYCRLFNQLYGVPTVVLRYFNVYGPFMDPQGAYALVVGKFLDQRRRGEALTISGDGEYYRAYTHVHDIVRANLLAMESEKVGAGEIINIGSTQPTSVNELAALIGGPVVHVAPRPGDPRHSEADCVKARTLLGWQATIRLEDGIQEMKKLWNVR
jgi:UDP-glucose 4-epimerase